MSILHNKPFRFLVTSLCVLALYYGAASFCNRQTDGFSVARIHSDLPYNSAWETAPLAESEKQELLRILDQKFSYLGFGGQCYAFASEDGNYVIKFFKHKIRKPFSFLLQTPLPQFLEKTRQKKLHKAQFKLERDFNSYKIAYEDLKEETGLLFLHLNKSHDLKRSVTIIDKLEIAHEIALDEIEFIVQKRAKLAYEYIQELMEAGDTPQAKKALRSLLQIVVSRCKKGIFDEDAKIHRNFGFINEDPIFIDVGRFRRDPQRTQPAVYRSDLSEITGRFREWLEESYPTLVPILDEEMHAYQENP